MGARLDPNAVRIRLLGGFQVWVGLNAIEDTTWRLSKSKAIVKLLALAPGQSLARDQILDALWPRLSADDAVNNFHQTLYAARRTFARAFPSAANDTFLFLHTTILTLRSPGGLWIDVEEFERAADAALASRDIALYEHASSLYAGDLLPEDRYEDWAAGYRDALARRVLSLLLGLAQLQEDTGQVSAAIKTLDQALEHEPADEDVHARLMRLYALSGQPQQALRQYERLQEVLRQDLDAAPQPSTVQLHDDILSGRFPPPDVRADRAAASAIGPRPAATPIPRAHPARRRPEVPPGNLPTPLTSFIGRERELATLRDLLVAGRLVTLTGPGGSGKTRLALELAARARDRFPDGTWWVDLQGLRDPSLVPFEIASALGIREQPGRAIEARIAERLRGHQALLVLDNCEHLVAGCAAIAEYLLRHCERLHIVATSRERLGVTGETRWVVPPMAIPPPGGGLPVAEILSFEAVQLFVNRSGYVRPGFTINESSAQTIAQICRQVDGLPLLIELAASRSHLLSLEVIRDRLADRLSTFTLPGAAESRYRTASEAIGWSYRLLSEEERRLFTRLGVFAGPFTLEAAQAICGDSATAPERILDLLSSLVDKSMVSIEESAAGVLRYRMLETLRQYALERLTESGEAGQIRQRCCEWYVGLAERADAQFRGRRHWTMLHRLEEEMPNLRAVVAWCHGEEERTELFLRLVGSLGAFWMLHGDLHEGRAWLEVALAKGEEMPAPLRARAHSTAGSIAKEQGDLSATRCHLEAAVELWRAVGNCDSEGLNLCYLGNFYQNLGEYTRAQALYQECGRISRAAGHRPGEARALACLGALAQDQGDYAVARAMYEESVAIFRDADIMMAVAQLHSALGRIAQDQGDFETARSLYQRSLEYWRELDIPGGSGISLYSLGRVAHLSGDLEQARALYRESLAIFNKTGNRFAIGWCLRGLGEVARLNGETASARALLQESLGHFRDLSFKEGIGTTLAALAGVAAQDGDREQALALYREAMHLLGELGVRLRLAECLEGVAGIAASDGTLAEAARLVGAAAALREAMGTPIPPCARPEVDRTIDSMKAGLGPEAYASVWDAGGHLSLDQALALVHSVPPRLAKAETST